MKKVLLFATAGLIFFGCNTATKDTHADEAHNETHEHVSIDDAENHELELDGQARWIVNEEMKPFVSEGEALVERFQTENKDDFKALSTQLKEQNDALIKSCTMTGKSHDELHKWLHPHLELVADLESAADNQSAKDIVTKLSDSYKTYHQYFQ